MKGPSIQVMVRARHVFLSQNGRFERIDAEYTASVFRALRKLRPSADHSYASVSTSSRYRAII